MGKKSRDKGNYGELWLRNKCREHGWDAVTGRQHRGGPDSPDVRGTPRKDGPIHFPLVQLEMKFGYDDGLNVLNCYDKLRGETPSTSLPVLVWKKTRKRALAILDIDQLFDIINESNEWWEK
jgi:hypothetical protein